MFALTSLARRRRDQRLRLDVRIGNSLSAVGGSSFARGGNEDGAENAFAGSGGGVTWKVALVSLPAPSSFTGMLAGSTFQPAGASKATFAAEIFGRREHAHGDRLRLRITENKNRLRNFDESRRGDHERLADFPRDPVDLFDSAVTKGK